MSTKEIKIAIPEGYEFDKENSTSEYIKFKKKERTYLKVHKALFGDGDYYYISVGGNIVRGENSSVGEFSHLAKHSSQLEQILALNKLTNVAKYLNGDWKPDWTSSFRKWYIYYEHDVKLLKVECNQAHQHSSVYFKSEELAKQAIDILGEDEVKLALGV